MTRLALGLCLPALCLPAPSVTPPLNETLKRVEQRYNHAKTLKVQFNETYSVSGQPRKDERGALSLKKPGRMRWDYLNPAGKLFLSDGKDVFLFTPDSNRVEKMRLKESEDMRAPLAFLLGKLDFAKEFRDFEMQPAGGATLIRARARSEKLPYERIEMTVAPDFSIRKLVITGQDQSLLTFQFAGEQVNPALDEALFRFQMPPGATLVTPETGQ